MVPRDRGDLNVGKFPPVRRMQGRDDRGRAGVQVLKRDWICSASKCFRRLALACSAAISLQACVFAPQPDVHPSLGQTFRTRYFAVDAPLGYEWIVLRATEDRVVFARGNPAGKEGFIAEAEKLDLAQSHTREDFESKVKAVMARQSDSKRFDILEESFVLTEERGYLCIRHRLFAMDKARLAAEMPHGLEQESLYCRHPTLPNTGFVSKFLRRGDHRDARFHLDAENFIKGVQVAK